MSKQKIKVKQSLIDHCTNLVVGIRDGMPQDMQARITDNAAQYGAFLARELTRVKARSYDVKYARLKFREVFPITHETPPGTDSISIPTYDRSGIFKTISDDGTDLPRVDIKETETLVPVKQFGGSYGYSTRELRQSILVGKGLPQRKADAAMRASEEYLNRIAWFGDSGMYGLFTYPGIPRANVVNGAGGTPQWSTKTPTEILADMHSQVSATVENSLMAETPNTMLLPVQQYNLIANTRVSTIDDTSILQSFLKNNQYIETVLPINELAGAGTGGVDVMVTYTRDPMTTEMEIPMEVQQLPPQQKGLEWQIPMEGESGGLSVYYPLNFSIGESI